MYAKRLIITLVMACSGSGCRSPTGNGDPPGLVGLWTFNDPTDLSAATIGKPLVPTGSPTAAAGPASGNGAVSIGAGSYYTIDHGLAPSGGGTLVNQWTLVIDFMVPELKWFNGFFQTDPTNLDDADCFVDFEGRVGVAATGYSASSVSAGRWYRMIVIVDNGNRYEIYLNGNRILAGTPGAIDGRFALRPRLLLGADDNGEHQTMNIAELRLYDHALSAGEVATLEGCGGDLAVSTGPYLQNTKKDGITLMWETATSEGSFVDYGTSASYGRRRDATEASSGAGTWLHTAILTGLQPGTTYHYRASTSRASTRDQTFTTAPGSESDFSFGVWGDSQMGSMEPTATLMNHMIDQERVDLAISVGDMANDGTNPDDVRTYFLDRSVQIIGTRVPFYIAWGNHDRDRGALIRNYVDFPSKDRSGLSAGYGSFSFDYAGCHFICIDDYTAEADVADWVQGDLQSSAAKAARFIFAFIHRAPWYERWYEGEVWLRTALVPYLEQNGVAILFSGHMHGYERGGLNGVHYVTTGGGGVLDTLEPLVHDWPNITVGGYSDDPPAINHGLVNEYVKVEITQGGGTVEMMAFAPDGTFLGVLDQFQIGARLRAR